MTTEELLKPRFKVLCAYPGSHFQIGDILTESKTFNYMFQNSDKMLVANPGMYPSIFEELKWWGEREKNDFPEFLKSNRSSLVVKVLRLSNNYKYGFYIDKKESFLYFYDEFLPSTEAEYNDYISKNK